jgi:hypothetical protein
VQRTGAHTRPKPTSFNILVTEIYYIGKNVESALTDYVLCRVVNRLKIQVHKYSRSSQNMHLRLRGCPHLCYLYIFTMPETASLLPSRDDREEDPRSIIQSAKYLQVNKQFINDLNINVL